MSCVFQMAIVGMVHTLLALQAPIYLLYRHWRQELPILNHRCGGIDIGAMTRMFATGALIVGAVAARFSHRVPSTLRRAAFALLAVPALISFVQTRMEDSSDTPASLPWTVAAAAFLTSYLVARRLLCVGLTGGIASGKTSVSTAWADLGATIIDADVVARDVLAVGTPAHARVAAAFPSCVDAASHEVDRRSLRSLVMGDAGERRTLNGIMHPAILWALLTQ